MKKERGNRLLLAPLYLFSLLFVFFPMLYMFFLSFMTRGEVWGYEVSLTLENYAQMADPIYVNTFLQSLLLAVLTTLFVTLIGYPFGYFMARLSEKGKRRVMVLVMIPFWCSELIRLRGWTIVFGSNGLLDKILMGLHITEAPLKWLYSYPIVVFGMVYALLPFMMLCVYSSIEKMDWSLVEAARDLGATPAQAFWQMTFPLSMPGFLSGVVLTFVPSMGLFYVADILGGNKIVLIGSLIQQQMTKGRNLPFAAALAVILMILTTLMIEIYRRITHSRELEGIV